MAYTGVAGVAVLWTSTVLGMRRTGLTFTADEPLSSIGTDSRTIGIFVTGLVLSAVSWVAFTLVLHRRCQAPRSFVAVFLTAMVAQVVVAFVPIDGTDTEHAVHTVAGLTLGGLLPVIMWRFASGQPRGRWRRLAYGLVAIEVAGCLAGLALSSASAAPLAEIVAAVPFHAWIVAVTAHLMRSARRIGPPGAVDP